MNILKGVFGVNTSDIITAHNTIYSRLRLMKVVLPVYEENLAFCSDIIPELRIPEEAMSVANRFQEKMSKIKERYTAVIIQDGRSFTQETK